MILKIKKNNNRYLKVCETIKKAVSEVLVRNDFPTASFFKIPLRTLEDRFKNDEEVRNAIQHGRNLGKLSIRRKQIQIMDSTNNTTMAIWLGKQLLGQRDKHDIVTEDKATGKLSEALDIIQDLARNKK